MNRERLSNLWNSYHKAIGQHYESIRASQSLIGEMLSSLIDKSGEE